MTREFDLDEAIKHCEEIAEENYGKAIEYLNDREVYKHEEQKCVKCADEHMQLAEWLRDYKQLKEQEPTVTSTNNSGEMIYPQVEGITPTVALPDVDKDFQIGDEVRIIGSDPIYDDCDVGWVIRNASERVKTMYVMRNDGSADEENKAEWYKTGRHNAMLAEVIKQLPSIKPQTGHWIDLDEKSAVCSCCYRNNTLFGDYCKWCGAKMVEPQERSEE